MMRLSTQRLESRQRKCLNDLADRGFLYVAALGTSDKRTLTTLSKKKLATLVDGRYVITQVGYAWLIADAAEDMTIQGVTDAAARVRTRIAHLAELADIAAVNGYAVNWRGDRV